MVQNNESNETIIKSLSELGVEKAQAEKLLLIAQADTFTLLRKEINVMVKEEFIGQKSQFEDIIHADLAKLEEEEKGKVRELAVAQLGDVRQDVINEAHGFEERVNKTINTSQKTVSMVKIALDSINERIAQMELDTEQLKVHKFRKRSMVFSYIMLATGVMLLATSLILFLWKFADLDNTQILMIGIMVLASITLMFASVIS